MSHAREGYTRDEILTFAHVGAASDFAGVLLLITGEDTSAQFEQAVFLELCRVRNDLVKEIVHIAVLRNRANVPSAPLRFERHDTAALIHLENGVDVHRVGVGQAQEYRLYFITLLEVLESSDHRRMLSSRPGRELGSLLASKARDFERARNLRQGDPASNQ